MSGINQAAKTTESATNFARWVSGLKRMTLNAG